MTNIQIIINREIAQDMLIELSFAFMKTWLVLMTRTRQKWIIKLTREFLQLGILCGTRSFVVILKQ